MAVIGNEPPLWAKCRAAVRPSLFALSAEKAHAKYEFTESVRGDSS
jgi:hypothetical protein